MGSAIFVAQKIRILEPFFEKIAQQKWFLELIEDAFGILKLFELGLGT